MDFTKQVRKIISFLIPSGQLKELGKLYFYNLTAKPGIHYKILKDGKYITTVNELKLITHEALYFIAPDFLYYEYFHQVKKGENIIDAGANFGHLTVYFSKQTGNTGRVIAFEPDNINLQYLKKNLALNPDLPNNISIDQRLLWNAETVLDFCEAGTVASSAIYFENGKTISKKKTISLDTWMNENPMTPIHFIKMDIEGAEIETLKGAVKFIHQLKPDFAIASYHQVDNKPTYLWVENFFKELNYPYRTITFAHDEIITFAGPSVK